MGAKTSEFSEALRIFVGERKSKSRKGTFAYSSNFPIARKGKDTVELPSRLRWPLRLKSATLCECRHEMTGDWGHSPGRVSQYEERHAVRRPPNTSTIASKMLELAVVIYPRTSLRGQRSKSNPVFLPKASSTFPMSLYGALGAGIARAMQLYRWIETLLIEWSRHALRSSPIIF